MKWIPLMLALHLIPSVTFAMGGKGDHQQKAENLKRELNLTDEQLAKVQEIRKSHKDDRKSEKLKLKEEKKIFREAMNNPAATKEELLKKYEAYERIKNDYHRKKFNMMLAMRETLNPEQRQKFAEMKKKHFKGDFKKDKKEKRKSKK